MLTRIVKLHFAPEHVGDFLQYFDSIKQTVNTFPGCRGMKLLHDKNNPCIVFTYSLWESEATLEAYRTSPIFQEIWPKIKSWFDHKAEAWSVNTYFDGFEIVR